MECKQCLKDKDRSEFNDRRWNQHELCDSCKIRDVEARKFNAFEVDGCEKIDARVISSKTFNIHTRRKIEDIQDRLRLEKEEKL